MGFLDMGTLEILLILVVALIIWGPDKIPGIARTLGNVLRNLRKATTDFTATITKELTAEEKGQPSQAKAATGNTKESPEKPKDQPSQPEADTGNNTTESPDNSVKEAQDETARPQDQ
ncbi:MAG: twin-arginine translocase TatA/TatE family subunit [Dehalococcoidales bacterium]|nr:MAG: twin-arginine translocase TatA/TatE family subunit [Dehalococcoidales bacterium]